MALILTLLSSADTAARKQGAFPCAAAPLSASADRRARSIKLDLHRLDGAWSAPETACRQTAAVVGLSATSEPALAEPDYGPWAGRTIRDVMDEQPEQFARWLHGEFMPGSESMADLFVRIRRWLSSHLTDRDRMIAVASPMVVRACALVALDLTPAHFSRLDIPSLTLSVLTSNGRDWRVRTVGAPPAFSTRAENVSRGEDSGAGVRSFTGDAPAE